METKWYHYAAISTGGEPISWIFPCTVQKVGNTTFAINEKGSATQVYDWMPNQGIADTEQEARAAVAQHFKDKAAELLAHARKVEANEPADAT